MNEKCLNHDLIRLFNDCGGFAYKIPDPSQEIVTASSKRPFDGFARFRSIGDIYFESKLIKNKLQAFSFKRIEPHQIEALTRICDNGGEAVVILGYWEPRKAYWFMLFDICLIQQLIKAKVLSIKQKELMNLQARGCSISLTAKDRLTFSPEILKSKIIRSLE